MMAHPTRPTVSPSAPAIVADPATSNRRYSRPKSLFAAILLLVSVSTPFWGAPPALADAAACGGPAPHLQAIRDDPGVGSRVRVNASVTAVYDAPGQLGGFFVEQREPSAGLFVYAPRPPAGIAPGQRVVFEARIDEFHGRRQLRDPSNVVRCGSDPIEPAPIALTPGAANTPNGTPLDTLVRLAESTVTDTWDLGRYGSLTLAAERLFSIDPDSHSAPTLVLDDASYRRDPDTIPYLDSDLATRRVGDRSTPITGILTEAFDERRLHPVGGPQSVRFSQPERPDPPPRTDNTLRIATFNLENLFLTLGKRGADDAAALERQQGKLVAALVELDADVVALTELENRPGVTADLVRRLNARLPNERHYALVPHPAPGTDAIAVGLIHRPAVVEAIDSPRSLSQRAHERTPLRVQLAAKATPNLHFDVTVVHMRSRGRCPASSSGDIDRGQGCWNFQRDRQMDAILRQLPDTDRPAILIGDFNAHPGEDPLNRARDAGFEDLRTDPPAKRSTYVYRGRSAPLDHALGATDIRERVVAAGSWAINADEPRFGRYNGRNPFPGPWRSSDHDPVWLDLRLDP